MLLVILASVGCTLLAVALLGLFVWWLTGLCTNYDANLPGGMEPEWWAKESFEAVERNMVESGLPEQSWRPKIRINMADLRSNGDGSYSLRD